MLLTEAKHHLERTRQEVVAGVWSEWEFLVYTSAWLAGGCSEQCGKIVIVVVERNY